MYDVDLLSMPTRIRIVFVSLVRVFKLWMKQYTCSWYIYLIKPMFSIKGLNLCSRLFSHLTVNSLFNLDSKGYQLLRSNNWQVKTSIALSSFTGVCELSVRSGKYWICDDHLWYKQLTFLLHRWKVVETYRNNFANIYW